MYGMVNEAIRTMVVESFDANAWEEICKELKLTYKAFIPFQQYDDQITLDLVTVISKKVNLEPIKLLEDFGKYWVKYAKQSEYSSILESFATSPVELLESLDNLHTRLELTFDELKAPSFWVTHISKDEIFVHYQSKRDMPLEWFVVGLIHGIFDIFGQTCDVEIVPAENGEKAVFKVNF